jgi:hypothetical protein
MKKHVNKFKSGLAIAALATIPFSSAFAGLAQLNGEQVVPKIVAGGADAIDGAPILPAGEFTGVVSLSIETEAGGFICTGSVISKRHIITAAHCIEDGSGTGAEIDINKDGVRVRTVFTDGGELTGLITASAIKIHPDYDGFANCGEGEVGGLTGSCLHDDIAIITLEEEIPAGVEIYEFADQVMDGQLLTMVGHGTSGNGIVGDAISPSFFDKRIGFNFAEIFDCDDGSTDDDFSGGWFNSAACGEFYGNEAEVWYADFDGFDANGDFQNSWCSFFGLGCDEEWLGETFSQPYDFATLFEASIGGGDSGGPSFVLNAVTGKFELIANNTFGSTALGGAYGSWFGGNVYAAYTDFIEQVVPAPAGLGLILLSLGAFGLKRRKANKA